VYIFIVFLFVCVLEEQQF